MDTTEQAIWDDFLTYSKIYARVKSMLSNGKNVVVVLLDGVAGLGAYETDSFAAVMGVKDELLRNGATLPIANDNLPRMAFIVWKSTDQIDQPEELSTVGFAGRVFDGKCEIKHRWFGGAETQR